MSDSTFGWENSADLIVYTDAEARAAVWSTVWNGLEYNSTTGSISVKVQKSIAVDANGVQLSGDETSPWANKVYGTDASGVRTWKADPVWSGTTSDKYRRDLKRAPTIYFDSMDSNWVNWYGGATWVHDTSIKQLWAWSVQLPCPTSWGLVGMRRRIVDTAGANMTLNLWTGNYWFEIYLRCTNWSDIVTLELLIGNVLMTPNYWKLDIINTVTQTSKISAPTLENSTWIPFTFSQADFDVQTWVLDWATTEDIIIRATSTPGTTPTVWADSFRIVPQVSEWSVLFCADDGWNDQTNLLDIADKYGQQICLFIIPSAVGTAWYFTQWELDDIHERGHIIGMHGATALTSMSGATLDAEIAAIVAYRDSHSEYMGSHMIALPEGKINTEVFTKLKPHFKYIFSIDEQKAYPYDNECVRIPRRSLLNTTPTATATWLMDAAMNWKGLQIINFHHVITTPVISTDYSIANTEILFKHVIDADVNTPSWLKLFP